MRILILSVKNPFPPKDGGAIATLNLATGLAQAGNEVCLMCFNTRKHYLHQNEIPDKFKKEMEIIFVDHNTSINYFGMLINLLFSRKPYNAIRFNSKAFRDHLKEILIKDRFDIVQLEGPYMSWYIPVIKAFSNARISLRAHNTESEIWNRKATNERNYLYKTYFKLLAERIYEFEKETMENVDLLVSVAKEVSDQLLPLNTRVAECISPVGFDIEKYPASITRTPYKLFYIGSLEWLPNQEAICWFIDRVWNNLDLKITLHIAGRNAPGWLKRKFLSTSGITFHGEVENAIEFIRKNDVLISPLLSGSGIRVKILEAMLSGKIVIANRISAEGIPVTNGENIIFADTAEEYKFSIESLFNNQEAIYNIGEEARKLITENFHNLALSKKLTDFYSFYLK